MSYHAHSINEKAHLQRTLQSAKAIETLFEPEHPYQYHILRKQNQRNKSN